jgi:hypothetical protein
MTTDDPFYLNMKYKVKNKVYKVLHLQVENKTI